MLLHSITVWCFVNNAFWYLTVASKFGLLTAETRHLFRNGGQAKYYFVFMLMSLTNLARMCKIQKNFSSKMRLVGLVGLINVPLKEQ